MWLAVTAVPAVYSSIARGAHELALVASHLAQRAHLDGVQPDPDKIRRVAVQVVSGRPVDPQSEPGHGPLAWRWARRAVRATVPMAGGVRTRDPDRTAASAAAVDARSLARDESS
jgi:hypothetical protein